MKLVQILLLAITIYGCKNQNSQHNNTPQKKKPDFYLKKEIDINLDSKFFKDYNIFERKGYYSIDIDTLYPPFFQVCQISDSTLLLKKYYDHKIKEYIVPIAEQIIYTFHDINDGPRHIFSKISDHEIIRYGYDSFPYEKNSNLFPREIEIIKRDTIYTFFTSSNSGCLDTTKTNGKVLPFKGKLNRNCDNCLVLFFSEDLNDSIIYNYYRYFEANEKMSQENPGYGHYGYMRKFTYWRDFHDLNKY